MRESKGDKVRALKEYRDAANEFITRQAALLEIAIKAVETFARASPPESSVGRLAAFLRLEQGKMLGVEPEAVETPVATSGYMQTIEGKDREVRE